MKSEFENAIKALIGKAVASADHDAALKFSQSALNLAHARSILHHLENK